MATTGILLLRLWVEDGGGNRYSTFNLLTSYGFNKKITSYLLNRKCPSHQGTKKIIRVKYLNYWIIEKGYHLKRKSRQRSI